MSDVQIAAMAEAALARLLQHINRRAAQQIRRMRESWGKAV